MLHAKEMMDKRQEVRSSLLIVNVQIADFFFFLKNPPFMLFRFHFTK